MRNINKVVGMNEEDNILNCVPRAGINQIVYQTIEEAKSVRDYTIIVIQGVGNSLCALHLDQTKLFKLFLMASKKSIVLIIN